MRDTIGLETEEDIMSSQAIVTGLDGPKRRPIETDKDLQEFWESLSGGTLDGVEWGTMSKPSSADGGSHGCNHGRLGKFGNAQAPGGAEGDAGLLQQEFEDYKAAAEQEVESYKRCIDNLNKRMAEMDERMGELQSDNLEFISQFETRLKEKETILIRDLQQRFQDKFETQAREIVNANSKLERSERIVQLRDQQIKEQESEIRVAHKETQKLEKDLRREKERFEKQGKQLVVEIEAKTVAAKEAEVWKKKYEKTVEEDSQRDEGGLDFRILNFTKKCSYYTKGRMLQSPEFEVPGLPHPIQFEFFPNGDHNAQDGFCSLKLRVPDCTTLRWRAYIGRLKIGPRTDHFESRHWWNKHGLVMLNMCSVADMKRQISSETDSLVVGVEIQGSEPITALSDIPRSPEPSRPSSAAVTREDDEMSIGEHLCSIKGRHRKGNINHMWHPHGKSSRPGTAPAGSTGNARSQPSLGFGLRAESRPKTPTSLTPLKGPTRAGVNTSISTWPSGALSPDPRPKKNRGF